MMRSLIQFSMASAEIRVLIRSMFVVILFVLSKAQADSKPVFDYICLNFKNICIAKEPLLTESQIRARLGAAKRQSYDVHGGGFGYCYRFVFGENRFAYGWFMFEIPFPEARLLGVRLASESICEGATDVNLSQAIETQQGIGLGNTESDIVRIYGQPTFVRNPNMSHFKDYVKEFTNGQTKLKVEKIFRFNFDPSNSFGVEFYLSKDKVVGIETSISE